MNVICIDERVWTSLVAKLESLAATALRVEKITIRTHRTAESTRRMSAGRSTSPNARCSLTGKKAFCLFPVSGGNISTA